MRKAAFTTLSFALLAAGCASSPTPNYDARFGEAVRQSRLAMTINPNAGSNPDPIAGMDGKSAHEGLGKYHDSFKNPPPVVPVINIGGAVSGRQ